MMRAACRLASWRYVAAMDSEDSPGTTWRERLPYVIGVLGLIAWFGLLYLMLRDVA